MATIKIKDLVIRVKCDLCMKKLTKDDPKFDITLYKWYEPNKGSAFELQCCEECARKNNLFDLAKNIKTLRELSKKK